MNLLSGQLVSKTEIGEFVHNTKRLLEDKYIYPEIGRNIAELLGSNFECGKYDNISQLEKFKEILDEDMQSINGDKHLHVWIQTEKFQKTEEVNDEEIENEYRRIAEKNNYGIHKVERLKGNIGYIDLRVFYIPEIAAETAVQTFNWIANTDALIIDLRKNIGGSPHSVSLILSYLVPEPLLFGSFYSGEEGKTTQLWTAPYVPGKLYLDKPVYILTSVKTFSAGEQFAYSLKNIERAKIVGETTAGAANLGRYHQVTKQLRVFIPSSMPISPVTNENWEGIGVTPDYEVDQDKAFEVAYQKALRDIKNKYEGLDGYRFLIKEIEEQLFREQDE